VGVHVDGLGDGDEEESCRVQGVETEEAEDEEVKAGGESAFPGFGGGSGGGGRGRGRAASTTTTEAEPPSEAADDEEGADQAYQGAGAVDEVAVEVERMVVGRGRGGVWERVC